MKQKKTLIKLSRPLLINGAEPGKDPNYKTIYGFLAPYDDDYDVYLKIQDAIWSYTGYLAAVHEWSNGSETFTLEPDTYDWIDSNGKVHIVSITREDDWTANIYSRCRSKLNLFYEQYTLDMDDIDQSYLDAGTEECLIISDTLMDDLVETAKAENEKQTVLLFNRPIFLPTSLLWKGEKGYTHIYGVVPECPITETLLRELKLYLGYLAMCEEVSLNNITPSGFTAVIDEDDSIIWYNNGTPYAITDIEVLKEGSICRSKHNLKILGDVGRIPNSNLIDGVRDGFVIDKALYEDILDTSDKGRMTILDVEMNIK